VTRLRTALACAVLASLPAACGSSTTASGVDPETALSETTEQTLAEKSARVDYSWHSEGQPVLPGSRALGDVSFVTREARLSDGGARRSVYKPSEFWVRSPIAGMIVPGKKWVRYDRTDFKDYEDDTVRLLPYLAAGATRSSTPDEAEVNGIETLHYEANVDVERALDAVPEKDRDLARTTLESELLGRTGRVEFWIDDKGRLRRIRVHIPPGRKYSHTYPNGDSTTLESGPTGGISTLDYSELGIEVDTTPPPADEVGEPGG
jgi:hypothetical protein